MDNKYDSFLNHDDIEIDKKTERNLAAIADLFNAQDSNNYDENDLTSKLPFQYNSNSYDDSDSLNNTQEIDGVSLEELKKIRNELSKLDNQGSTNIGVSSEKPKVLVKQNGNGAALYNPTSTDDVKEIVSSFINCFVLAFVTAAMGTGWLLNLIINIM